MGTNDNKKKILGVNSKSTNTEGALKPNERQKIL